MRLVALIVFAACFTVPAQQQLSEEQAHLLNVARATAIRYGASLPSFICEESVERAEVVRQHYATSDKLSIELTFDRAERYKLTAINGNRTDKSLDSIGGLISGGEFGSLMLRVFQPSSAADFEWKSWSTLRNHRTAVFTYRVPRPRSHYLVGYRTDYGRWISAVAGYRGEVTLDAEVEPGRVLRLTAEAYDIPGELHILRSTMAVDYDFVDISGREVYLPVRSETYFDREERHSHNLIRFSNYRKFETDSNVTFGSSELPLNRFAPPPPGAPVAAPITIPDPPVLSLPPGSTAAPVELRPFTVPAAAPSAPVKPKPPNDIPPATFRASSQLAVVGFQVLSAKGQLIRNLRPDEVELRDDGVPQKIALLEGDAGRAGGTPVDIALLFDCSRSVEVAGALDTNVFEKDILDEFENVRIAIYGFSDREIRTAAPTRDAAALKKAADSVRTVTPGGTPLFGAITDTARDFGATARPVVRMMAILSDGESSFPGDGDRVGEAISAARESGIALFPIMLTKSAVAPDGLSAPSIAPTFSQSNLPSIKAFMDLAPATGGRALSGLMNTDVVPSILKSLATQIRGSYVAGYYPEQSATPTPHKVEIVLVDKQRGRLYGGVRTVVH
jgi:VWFA-related protein